MKDQGKTAWKTTPSGLVLYSDGVECCLIEEDQYPALILSLVEALKKKHSRNREGRVVSVEMP